MFFFHVKYVYFWIKYRKTMTEVSIWKKQKPKPRSKLGVKTPSWVKMAVRNRALYLFLLPAVLYMAIFNYAPMFGIQIAFRDFTPAKGVWGSPWVGFEYFEKFFTSYSFWTLLKNTLTSASTSCSSVSRFRLFWH